MVYCVWKVVGNEWWPSKKSNNPSWPIKASETKLYRVGLREVTTVQGETNNVFKFRCHKEVFDGVNVSNVYKIESIADIMRLLLKVDIN